MKKAIHSLFGCFCLVALAAEEALAQHPIVEAKQYIWKHKQYDKALAILNNYPAKGEDIFEVDLLMAVCYCEKGNRNDGMKLFDWILTQYNGKINAETKTYITNAKGICGEENRQIKKYISQYTITSRSTGPSVYGKELYDAGLKNKNPEKIEMQREIPPKEYEARLFKTISEQAASEHIRAITKEAGLGTPQVRVTDHFVLASFSSQDVSKLEEAGKLLERNMKFYSAEYKLDLPENKITAYFVKSPDDLRKLASAIHGIGLKSGNIGYSVLNDVSIAGVDYDLRTGTLNHELMHILINYNCPYLQPWLAEGMPSLYESHTYSNGKVMGVSNWRLEVLKMSDEKVPLEAVVQMDWSQFDGVEGVQYEHPLLKQATAKYFVLYLQEQGYLSKVFAAFKEARPRPTNNAVSLTENQPVKVIERILGKDMLEIQRGFDNWVRGL